MQVDAEAGRLILNNWWPRIDVRLVDVVLEGDSSGRVRWHSSDGTRLSAT